MTICECAVGATSGVGANNPPPRIFAHGGDRPHEVGAYAFEDVH